MRGPFTAYRDRIRTHVPDAFFVALIVSREAIEARLKLRARHFMPRSLLDSQLSTLEPLYADESGICVDANLGLPMIVAGIVRAIRDLENSDEHRSAH